MGVRIASMLMAYERVSIKDPERKARPLWSPLPKERGAEAFVTQVGSGVPLALWANTNGRTMWLEMAMECPEWHVWLAESLRNPWSEIDPQEGKVPVILFDQGGKVYTGNTDLVKVGFVSRQGWVELEVVNFSQRVTKTLGVEWWMGNESSESS